MTDRTVARRVRKYRRAQKQERRIARTEIQVPEAAASAFKAYGRVLRDKFQAATRTIAALDLVLGTINAPRPRAIDAPTLLACLLTPAPRAEWQAHVAAVFGEVSPDALHELVLAGVFTFEDLNRAARDWRIRDGRNLAWISEMAELGLARPAADDPPGAAGAAGSA